MMSKRRNIIIPGVGILEMNTSKLAYGNNQSEIIKYKKIKREELAK